MATDGTPWMDAKGAANYMGVKVRTLYDWRIRGIGPEAYRLTPGARGPLRFNRADLDNYMRGNSARAIDFKNDGEQQ